MNDTRIGFGYDAHRFGGDGPVVLCGVPIEHHTGVVATSDGDVAIHALCDAILGAAAAGDLGALFPSSDPDNAGRDSREMLVGCVKAVFDRGYDIVNVDVTIIAQDVRVAPHREAMREALSPLLRLPPNNISVKGTTTDGMGWIGAGEGIASYAVVSLQR